MKIRGMTLDADAENKLAPKKFMEMVDSIGMPDEKQIENLYHRIRGDHFGKILSRYL